MTVSGSMISQLLSFKNVIQSRNVTPYLLQKFSNRTSNLCLYSTENTTNKDAESTSAPKTQELNKAMLAYLERAKAHDDFIKKEKTDFLIGKRHLANMMGEDIDTFTQDDIDRSIEYLFPSGLFDKKARPVMRPPEELFPPKKAAQFDTSGRPFHTMFYTSRPNFYKVLYDIVEQMEIVNKFEDKMIAQGIPPDPKRKIDLSASDWFNHKQLNEFLLEDIVDVCYDSFITTIERLADHPYSYHVEDFIMKYRVPRKNLIESSIIPPFEYDPDGRPFITVPDCMRKSARASVTVKGQGSGKIIINGKPLIRYFENTQDYEQIIFPLHFTGKMFEVDVEAQVREGGRTGQAGAIRWGIAWALRNFVDSEMLEKMRLAGLLTRDWRRRERKKPGQEGARRKFTWKRR